MAVSEDHYTNPNSNLVRSVVEAIRNHTDGLTKSDPVKITVYSYSKGGRNLKVIEAITVSVGAFISEAHNCNAYHVCEILKEKYNLALEFATIPDGVFSGGGFMKVDPEKDGLVFLDIP